MHFNNELYMGFIFTNERLPHRVDVPTTTFIGHVSATSPKQDDSRVLQSFNHGLSYHMPPVST